MTTEWVIHPLADVTSFLGGGTPAKARTEFWRGDIPWVSPKDMKSDVVIDSQDKITSDAIENSATKLIPKGSVLVVVRSGILARAVPIAIAGRDLTINQDLKAILPKKKLDARFLAYFLRASEVNLLDSVTRGATVHRLTTDVLKTLPIPLPPLEEQRRIVAVLDEAFEGLDRAGVHVEENLQNARELAATVIDTEFSKIFVSVDGRELQSLCTNRGITYGVIKLGDHISDGVPCLRTSNVRPLAFDLDGLKRISPELSQEYSRTILEGGELLVSVRGTLGGVAIVPPSMSGWNISREVAMVAVDDKRIDPKYAAFFLTTSRAKAWLADVVTGATYRGINLADLRKIVVPCPSPTEQQALVQRLSEVKNANGQLLEACNRKFVDLEDLRKSLLQSAFAGGLT